MALLGLWLGVFLGDIDSDNAVSCTILIVWTLYYLIDLQHSPILQSLLPKDSDCVPQTWFEELFISLMCWRN